MRLSNKRITQFGCALAGLNVEILCANSSQTKGRVERANRARQDRLVKALRLAKISTIEDANAFLPAPKVKSNSEKGGYKRRGRKPGRRSFLDNPDYVAKRRKERYAIEAAERT